MRGLVRWEYGSPVICHLHFLKGTSMRRAIARKTAVLWRATRLILGRGLNPKERTRPSGKTIPLPDPWSVGEEDTARGTALVLLLNSRVENENGA